MKNFRYLTSLLANLTIVFVIYTICRIEFLLENLPLFTIEWGDGSWLNLFRGGMIFDISAICYTNIIYIVCVVFPCHYKENTAYYKIIKWL